MNLIRTIVSGKKKRLKESNYNLDLTYITPRVLAMSYPGSGLEITYRNNIEHVSKFLLERHTNEFHVFNLSGIAYDYSKFQNNFTEIKCWDDHHGPPIHILFKLCH